MNDEFIVSRRDGRIPNRTWFLDQMPQNEIFVYHWSSRRQDALRLSHVDADRAAQLYNAGPEATRSGAHAVVEGAGEPAPLYADAA